MPNGSATFGTIVVSSEPRGRYEDCIVDGALYPGTIVEVKAATQPVLGRFTFGAAAALFGALAILVEDWTQGVTVDTAYTSGARGRIYWPQPGDDLLCRCVNATYAIGDVLGIGSGGLLQISTGTLGPQPFQCFDTLTTGSGPYLALCKYGGH